MFTDILSNKIIQNVPPLTMFNRKGYYCSITDNLTVSYPKHVGSLRIRLFNTIKLCARYCHTEHSF